MQIQFKNLRGREAKNHIDVLANLRIQIFYDWPYLYQGSLAYETEYLKTYFNSQNSFVCLAIDGNQIVGAATAIWLPEAEPAFQQPFAFKKMDLAGVCYYGESVLLPDYRGYGIGRKFMNAREGFARSLPGVTTCAFCAVVRPENHPLKPKDYKPLDEFWQSCGFVKQPDMITEYAWSDRGEKSETKKPMQFWLKKLEI